MIKFYRHKEFGEYTQKEIDMLGFEGVKKYAAENGRDANELFSRLLEIENLMKGATDSVTVHDDEFNRLFEQSIGSYIDYFNNGAKYDKQAYIVIGNIASGKSRFSRKLEEETNSIIIDPDRIKMGEDTKFGFYEGISRYYIPEECNSIQEEGSDGIKQVMDKVSDLGMNLILPTAPTSLEKLEKKVNGLIKKNYDVHLFLMETPLDICADRNYNRFMLKEYSRKMNPNGFPVRGRFVQRSVLIDRADSCYATFFNAYRSGKFKKCSAIYNDNVSNEEIDLDSMQQLG